MLKEPISLKDPKTKIILISLAIIIGTYMSCQKFVLQPRKEKISKSKQKLEHIQLEDTIGRLYHETRSFEKILSPQKDSSWLRVEITKLAQKAGLDITSIEPLPEKKIPPYIYTPFKIKTACTYKRLIEFIQLTESSSYLIAIESLQLKSPEDYKLIIHKKESPKKARAEIEIVIGTVF